MSVFSRVQVNSKRVSRVSCFAPVLVLSLMSVAEATIIDVPADQATIQAGIDVAVTGDTVLVAPGYYLENITFQGKEITVSSHFLLDRDPAFIFTTTIDGSNAAVSDSASTVRIFCAATEAPVFQGFTVTGGGGTRMSDPTEGGYNRVGGGIATRLGAPVIRFNYIHHNQPNAALSVAGGGIYLQRGNPVVENNLIVHNPGRSGCGIANRAANTVARNNVIAYNSGGGTFGGAGVYLYQGQFNGYNNTIVFNTSIQPGGGVRAAAGSILLYNSIVWGNESNTSPQTHIDPIYGGTIALQYSDIEGGYAGAGNIDTDPLVSGPWLVTGEASPCIDAGDPDAAQNDQSWPSDPTAARWPSRGEPRNDLGAYGGPGCYPLELATIRNSDTLGWVPWEVSFEAESYFEADSWTWEFGDGDGAAGQAVVHTYNEPGAYDVTLAISHDAGQTYQCTREELVCALADTVSVGDIEFAPSTPFMPIEIVVQAGNNAPLTGIWIPITYSGDLQMDYESFSTAGCRTGDFETQVEYVDDPGTKTVVIQLSGGPGLPPGNGAVVKLLFYTISAQVGQSATISLTSGSELFTGGPQFISSGVSYQPATVSGSIRCECCLGRVGDANGSGEDEPTIGDVSAMIDAKFITGECIRDGAGANIRCLGEADVNLSGGNSPVCDDITIGDISMLIDCLFITGEPPFVRNECAR